MQKLHDVQGKSLFLRISFISLNDHHIKQIFRYSNNTGQDIILKATDHIFVCMFKAFLASYLANDIYHDISACKRWLHISFSSFSHLLLLKLWSETCIIKNMMINSKATGISEKRTTLRFTAWRATYFISKKKSITHSLVDKDHSDKDSCTYCQLLFHSRLGSCRPRKLSLPEPPITKQSENLDLLNGFICGLFIIINNKKHKQNSTYLI